MRRKPGPIPKPKSILKRHAVMVKFDDAEWRHLKATALPQPNERRVNLAAHLRVLALAVKPKQESA